MNGYFGAGSPSLDKSRVGRLPVNTRRSAIARDLRTPKYRARTVASKKAYSRARDKRSTERGAE